MTQAAICPFTLLLILFYDDKQAMRDEKSGLRQNHLISYCVPF